MSSTPTDGTDYTAGASTTFGAGTDLGGSEYVVYSGSGTTVTVDGMACGTTYFFSVFSYDCTPMNYKTNASGTASQATSACGGVSCTDNIKNQDETAIDCGGTICPACDCN